jgi:hypothetical protein
MRHLERAARERQRQMTVVVAWWTRCRGGRSRRLDLPPRAWNDPREGAEIQPQVHENSEKGPNCLGGTNRNILNLDRLHLLCLLQM